MYTWVYHSYLIYIIYHRLYIAWKKLCMSIYFIYHNYMIHHRLSVFLPEKKGCIHEYILYISYIIYHRLSIAWKKDVYMSISFIYYTSFIIVCLSIDWKNVYMSVSFIYHLSSFVCPLLEKNVYMGISFIYHNYMIHHRLWVCCLKKGCIREYILYVSYISYHRLLLEKKMYTWVYPLYIIYHLLSFVCCLNKGMYTWLYPLYMWASALCIRFAIIRPLLTDPQQFHYCTDSNPGTGADDAFVLKHGVWRNATWPSHSRPAIAASARLFQICFSPLTFWPLVVYLLFVYLVLFMHQAMSNIFWHLRMFI